MRILYIDIDTLRPDHLSCYSYHRKTSPAIDRIAADGVMFTNCYTSDAPCLPSRTALITGRFGIHTGVVGHGGTVADPFPEGRDRWFGSTFGETSWIRCLRRAGLRTVSITSFAERHSAWHWYSNFSEIHNPGKFGEERADRISEIALDWIQRNAADDDWFLHVNFWDPHTPYRTPAEYGDPFAGEPLPGWLTEEVRRQHWKGAGSWSAREGMGYGGPHPYIGPQYPRQPNQIDSMDQVRRMFDGYDTGIRYADDHIDRMLKALEEAGILDDLVIVVSADHGENLGELNIYYDHQTADQHTANVPLIIRWPGITDRRRNRIDPGLHYHFDWAATVIDLLGVPVPDNWDGQSFAAAFRNDEVAGRPYLVLSQGAHTCQRAVRFGDHLCIRSYHDGFHNFPEIMLYNLRDDPHEQHDLAVTRPETVRQGMAMMEEWYAEMMRTATHPTDPLWYVRLEGGPLHTRDGVKEYADRLRRTGREDQAEILIRNHPEVFK